jgi:hypothetical protein
MLFLCIHDASSVSPSFQQHDRSCLPPCSTLPFTCSSPASDLLCHPAAICCCHVQLLSPTRSLPVTPQPRHLPTAQVLQEPWSAVCLPATLPSLVPWAVPTHLQERPWLTLCAPSTPCTSPALTSLLAWLTTHLAHCSATSGVQRLNFQPECCLYA